MRKLLWGLLLLILAACAKPPQPVWTERPAPGQLLQRLEKITGQVDSIDGAAKVGLNVAGKYYSSQQFLLAEKPDRLRADALTGFGQLIFQLTTNGEELRVFLNTSVPGHFYRGPASYENLSRFTRLPLPAAELLRLLMYDPALIDYREAAVSSAEDGLLLKIWNPLRSQELLFDSQLQLIGCRYLAAGEVLLDVRYAKFTFENPFPRRIEIELPKENTRVSVKFSELALNVPIAAERFFLKQPENLLPEPLP